MGMSEWIPILVLPNLRLREPVGSGDIAVTSVDDNRIVDAVAEHPRVGEFLDRFTDAFGDPVNPTVLALLQKIADWAIGASDVLSQAFS
jgi:hypothetical protein